jgi:hypothetical protein
MGSTGIRNALAVTGALIVLAVGGCACTSHGSTGAGGGSGSSSAATGASVCEGARSRAESLYRAEAAARKPPGTDEEVADNVAMVVADCRTDPALVAACAARAESVAALERDCLIRIDDDGTEGRQFLAQ